MRSPAEKLFDGGKKSNIIGLCVMAVITVILLLCVGPATKYVKSLGRAQSNMVFTEGEYSGSANGFGGEVITSIVVSKNAIESVKIEGANETPDIGGKAIPVLETNILNAQTESFDGVSGATMTSEAVRTGLKIALAKAQGKEINIDTTTTPAQNGGAAVDGKSGASVKMEADIVVIGAGGAGMTAAIEAIQGTRNLNFY